MRILHTNFHRGWGGQSNRILLVCGGLRQRGHEVTIAAPAESPLVQKAAQVGIDVVGDVAFRRGFRPLSFFHDVYVLRRCHLTAPFDIIHLHGSQDSWACAFAFREMRDGISIVRTKHNIFPIRNHVMNRWLYGKFINHMVCISSEIYRYCTGNSYLSPERLSIIHSAVRQDVLETDQEKKDLREEWRIGQKFCVGTIGRLREEKGHRYLLQAIPKIVASQRDIVFVIVGDGSLRGELQALAQQLGIAQYVLFTGFRDDIRRVLGTCDLFVLPSVSEGLGTVLLEAAAAGIPIIATRVGGIPDIIQNGKHGLLVQPRSPDELAQHILDLYHDRTRGAELARCAREFVLENFSETLLVDKTLALYERLMFERTQPGRKTES